MYTHLFSRPLPHGLEGLADLALDLRWTWSHFSDRLWESLDPEIWERTGNPYYLLQSVSQDRLENLAADADFQAELNGWLQDRQRYLTQTAWFGRHPNRDELLRIAFFSMEFGLGEALPIYSGGLGVLSGDYLKAASDLGMPITGVGLLYQQGYFRQVLGADGWQTEAYPYNDPTSLPVTPARRADQRWLRIELPLPGRPIVLRVWEAHVGRVTLYLLDSNDPWNAPADRGATAHLYPTDPRARLTQEILLGMGGFRALQELGLEPDICHLNEGHAAFAVLARAASFMRRARCSFETAMWATRAGNIFTTHTPVEAAFDHFDAELIRPYAEYMAPFVGVSADELLALGRRDPDDADEPVNMALLALRGSGCVNGVSQLHGAVSRKIFQPLFPRWPEVEVPVGSITNGVHVPSWDSAHADALWTHSCGKARWAGEPDALCPLVEAISDSELWSFRAAQRQHLVEHVRRRLHRQLLEHAAPPALLQRAHHALDPNVLTLGFARRFTGYKRPTLLLQDPERLARILLDPVRPVQLVVAGKAHPGDEKGKRLVQAMVHFARRADVFDRVVFLEDYDMIVAGHLVAGIDVWINTPRRPWEACGTSGMKVLVNGGLNLSELDGWWAQAYRPEVGWALGDGREHTEPQWDEIEAGQLYDLLEREIVPAFYERTPDGIPTAWLKKVRASMAQLTPQFSTNRMFQEYVEKRYLPAARAYRRRAQDGGKVAADLARWHRDLSEKWRCLRFGELRVTPTGESWTFEVQVYCDEIDPDSLCVELWAEGQGDHQPVRIPMQRAEPIVGSTHAFVYAANAPASRPAEHYTPRLVPTHPDAILPLECPLILWRDAP